MIFPTRRAGLLSLDHACCGNAGLVEALAVAGEALARPELALAAEARLGAMLRRARLRGGFRLRGTEEENARIYSTYPTRPILTKESPSPLKYDPTNKDN